MRISLTRTLLSSPAAARIPVDRTPARRFVISRISDALFPALVLLALCAAPAAAHAQQTETPNTPAPIVPGVNPGYTSGPDAPASHIADEMARRRNVDRQKLIVADTAHLLVLAQKLNADVSKSSKDTLSISVVEEANEIEKLAKSIKEKMRDGQ
ncbi:MAG: hypothetical protein WA634_02670 [Silvibacterium sp.]